MLILIFTRAALSLTFFQQIILLPLKQSRYLCRYQYKQTKVNTKKSSMKKSTALSKTGNDMYNIYVAFSYAKDYLMYCFIAQMKKLVVNQ